MSGLGSLFSGMSADNNDALKYSAPKEPKQRSAKQTVTPTVEKVHTPVVAAPVAAAKAPGPSKIMASAAVRLFKINTATGGYDAVEGGGLLGCVMMGTGLTYQILIYNGQKVPQATVGINGTFDFTLRDLYMSFSDALGNQWSLLFDSVDVMSNFVRTVVATIVHCATHNPDTVDSSVTIGRALPRAEPVDEEDTALAQGMSAGIYLTAWEIQELADYPGDVVAGAPLKRVQAPDDVLKIKLSTTDEQIGGLSEAIVGLRKGDRLLVGVPPKIFYTGSADGPIDQTRRAHPGSWLLLEVEVVKIKSADKKKDKEKGNVKNSVPFEEPPSPAYAPDSPVQRLAKRNNSASFDDGAQGGNHNSGANNGNEIAARMARVAAQGGSGGGANSQLAGIMNNQRSPGSGEHNKSFNNHQQNQNNNYNNSEQYNRNNSNHNNNNNYNNQNNQNQSRQGGGNYHHNQQDNYSNDGQQYNNHNSNHNHNNYNNNHNNYNNQQYQENRVAVIEGQGVRSYYDSEDGNSNFSHDNNNYNRPHNNNNSNNNYRAPAAAPAPAVSESLTSAGLIQLHQSVAAVQQSMLQLHTKLDQVGTQVTNSAALQQQALVTTQSGGSTPGTAGMPGMLNPFGLNQLNPLQQQQMQLQLLQQQQQQQLYGLGGLQSLGGLGQHQLQLQQGGVQNPTGASSAQRLKTEELVVSLQALLSEYERHTSSGAGSGGAGGAAEVAAAKEEAKAAAKALRTTIEKLEEKNDTLQARYDKLMSEKSDLMEKYMEQFQTSSSATNKLYQSQQEQETLRVQHASLQREVEALRSAASSGSAGVSNKEKEQEQKNLIAELQHQVMALQVEVMESKQAAERARSSTAEVATLQAQLAQQSQELVAARADISRLVDQLESAHLETASATAQVGQYEEEERENRAKIVELQAALDAVTAANQGSSADAERVQQLQQEISDLKSQLATAESNAASLNLALDAVAAKAQETNDSTAATIADLKQQLSAALAAAAAAGENASSSGKADAEELKNIMQDVYLKACEVFDPEAEDSGEVQYSTQDIVKRLRAVLKRVTTERNNA